jgi:apolipoprotein N-acyltransferase
MATPVADPKERRRENPKRAEQRVSAAELSLAQRMQASLQTSLGLGLLGSLLVYLSLPPCNLWPLAWVAPVPWLLLIRQQGLSGKHPYRALWMAGFLFWLASIYWLCLPHWVTSFGWLALSFYLAFYLPVFIGLSRVAVQQLGISMVIAAPVVWTGLELARGHLLSGFTMGSLSHTQIFWPQVIQIADVIGDYGVSGLVMFVAACAACVIPWGGERLRLWPIPFAAIGLAAMLAYGFYATGNSNRRPGPTVALIQRNVEVEVKVDREKVRSVLNEYVSGTLDALARSEKIDLIVWPETMFGYPLCHCDEDFAKPADWDEPPAVVAAQSLKSLAELQNYLRSQIDVGQRPVMPPLLLGVDVFEYHKDRADFFNSALFVDPQGQPMARYDKMHPVMFGEYIPLAEYLPFLYKITPLTGGLTSGQQAVAQKLGDARYAPNICYETVIPHLIRRQVLELRARGEEPDILVNLTNDGWFRGSSELDMHLACGVFRAIEMRKPLLIAANTGLSAWISSDGRIVQRAPRQVAEVILAKPEIDMRHSFYLEHGDWFAGICLTASGGFAAVGVWNRRKKQG